MEFLENKFVLIALTFIVFLASKLLQRRTGVALLNPILVSIIILIVILSCAGVDYETYAAGGEYIDFWLKPAVVALGVPLYRQLESIEKADAPAASRRTCGMCGGNSVGCRRGRTARRHQGGGHVARTEGRHHTYRHGDFRRRRRYSISHGRRGCMYGHLRRHGRIPHGQDEPHQEPNRRRTVDRHRLTRRRHCLCHGARRALRSFLFVD